MRYQGIDVDAAIEINEKIKHLIRCRDTYNTGRSRHGHWRCRLVSA